MFRFFTLNDTSLPLRRNLYWEWNIYSQEDDLSLVDDITLWVLLCSWTLWNYQVPPVGRFGYQICALIGPVLTVAGWWCHIQQSFIVLMTRRKLQPPNSMFVNGLVFKVCWTTWNNRDWLRPLLLFHTKTRINASADNYEALMIFIIYGGKRCPISRFAKVHIVIGCTLPSRSTLFLRLNFYSFDILWLIKTFKNKLIVVGWDVIIT